MNIQTITIKNNQSIPVTRIPVIDYLALLELNIGLISGKPEDIVLTISVTRKATISS
jgi:hypothetical protein